MNSISPNLLGSVLVVDDEMQLMNALLEALAFQGYKAAGFQMGETALEALQTQEFDLLLTDLMMPGMDGITLLKAGLAIDPNLVGILMTGQGTVPTAVEAMKTGAFDYVLKPFRLETLLPVLARAMEVRRLRLENIQLRATVAIYNLSQTIAFSLDSKLVLEKTADAVLQQTEADELSIMLLTPEKQDLYIAAVRGRDREHLLGQHSTLQEGISGWVARQPEPLILNGEVSDPRFAAIQPRAEIRSAISIPMLTAGKLVGVLNVNSLQPHRSFTRGQIKALSILTSTAAAALENEALYSTLQAREKRFRALIENAPDGIALLGTDGKLRQLTPSTQRILGYTLESVGGQDPALLTHPDDLPALLGQLNDLIQNPGKVLRTQYRFRHEDGSWRWLDSTISNLIAEPSVGAIVFNYRDITVRKLAQEKLKLSDQILQRVNALVLVADSQGSITYISPAVKTILGYEPEELLGDNWWKVGRSEPMEAQREKEYLGQAARGEIPISNEAYERSIQDRSGNTHWVSWVDAAGLGNTLIGVGHDITERKRAEEKLQRRVEELEALYQSGLAFSQTFDQNKIAEKAIEVVRVYLNWHHAAVRVRRGETDELELLAFSRSGGQDEVEARIKSVITHVGQGLAGWVTEHGQALRAGNLNEDTRYVEMYPGMQSGLYVPLKIYEHTLGCISVESDQPDAFTQEDERLLSTLAVQAAVAIENARLYESALHAAQRRHVLYQTGQEMVRVTQDLEQIYAAVHHAVSQLMPTEAFSIILLDESRDELEGVYLFDKGGRWPAQRISPQGTFSDHVISTGQSILIQEVEKTSIEVAHYGTQEMAHSILAVPMRIGKRVIGVIATQSYHANAYSADDQRLLEMLASQTVIAIENARLFQTVQQELSERKRAEAALREKEQLLSEAQRIGHIGSWSYDIARDTLQYSDEMYRLFDVSAKEFQHNRAAFLSLIYSADRPKATQWMELITSGRQVDELEFRVFRSNGELRYLQCGGAVEFDTDGNAAHFIGTAQDVTERKLAEIQIHQQIERLTALNRIDQAIISSFDLNVTLDLLLSQVISQLQVDAADVLLLDPDGQVLKYAAGHGFRTNVARSARVRIGESHAGRAAQERRLIKIENFKDMPDDPLLTALLAGEDFVSYYAVPLIAKGKVIGVLEVFHRVPLQAYQDWLDFLNTLAGQAAIAIENAALFENLQRSNDELFQAYDATIEGWSHALDLRDKETEGHTLRVTEMTLVLARKFGFTEEQLGYVRWGALLHDIGKMGVPDNILLKPGSLTEDEWVSMKKHPGLAFEMLSPIAYLKPALDIPYCHHEKWDGTGYPRGLKREEIPLVARLFTVVDVWDALCSDRPYRSAWTKEKTLEHIKSLSGTHFDPKVVEYFLDLIK